MRELEGGVAGGLRWKRPRRIAVAAAGRVGYDGFVVRSAPGEAGAAGPRGGKQELPTAGKKRSAAAVAEEGEVSNDHVEKGPKRTRRADDVDGGKAAGAEGSTEVGGGSAEPEDDPAGLAGGSAGEGDSNGKDEGNGGNREGQTEDRVSLLLNWRRVIAKDFRLVV